VGAESVGGIYVPLGVDISGLPATIARANELIASLGNTKVVIRPTITRGHVDTLRAQTSAHFAALGKQGDAVAIPIRLGRVNWAALRSEISAGIGTIPVNVSLGRGASVLAAVIAQQTGANMSTAQSFVMDSARKRGVKIEGRAGGGSVKGGGIDLAALYKSLYIVGERGPELFVPHSAGWIIPNHLMKQLPHRGGGGPMGYAEGGEIRDPISGRFLAGNPYRQTGAPGVRGFTGPIPVEIVKISHDAATGDAALGSGGFDPRRGQPLQMAMPKHYDLFGASKFYGAAERLLPGATPLKVSGSMAEALGIESAETVADRKAARKAVDQQAIAQLKAGIRSTEIFARGAVAGARTGKSLAASLGGFLFGGREKEAQNLAALGFAREKAIKDISAFGSESDQAKASIEALSQAEKKAAVGIPQIARNYAAITASLFTYGVVIRGVSILESAAGPALKAYVDQQVGFQGIATQVTSALGQQTAALKGNAQAAVGAAAETAGLSASALTYVQSQLGLTASVKAGAQATVQAQALFRAAGAQGQTPQGLFGGYGGVLGSALLANQLGGGPGFTETLAGTLQGIRNPQAAPDIGTNISSGLSFLTNPDLRSTVVKGAQAQGNPFFDILQGLATPFLGGGAAAAFGDPYANQKRSTLPVKPSAAENALIENYNSGLQRGASALGIGTGAQLKYTSSIEAQTKAMTVAFAAGDVYGASIAKMGYVLSDAAGNLITDVTKYKQAQTAAAAGAAIPDKTTLVAQQQLQLTAQRATTRAQVGFQTGVQLPTQIGFGLLANPLIDPRAGVLPRGGIGAAGLSGSASSTVASALGTTYELQSRINKAGEQGLQIARQTVVQWGGDVKVFDSAIHAAVTYSSQIADIQTKIDFTQSGLSAQQFNTQMIFLRRNLSDALGLAGKLTGPNNLGALQRQEFMLGRQATALQLALSQRQITTQVALSKFISPGETFQEAGVRARQAQIEAKIAAEQLAIQKKQFGVQGQVFNVQAGRGIFDATKAIELAQAERNAAVQIAALSKELAGYQKLEEIAQAKAQAQFQGAVQNYETILSASAQMIATIPGLTLAAAMKAIKEAFFGANGAFTSNITATSTPQSIPPGASNAYGKNVNSIMRNTSVPATAAGGNHTTIVVQVSGSGSDHAAMVRDVTHAVTTALNRKGQLLGLRGPAY
jgi:hypothetical protein